MTITAAAAPLAFLLMRFRDLKLLDRRSLSGLLVGCIDDADKPCRRPGDLNDLPRQRNPLTHTLTLRHAVNIGTCWAEVKSH